MQEISVATEIVEYTQSFVTLLWHTRRSTFFSYTTPLYQQSKLQHAATICNERQNTDHCMAGPWKFLNKVNLLEPIQEDLGVRVPISGHLKCFAEDVKIGNWHLWKYC